VQYSWEGDAARCLVSAAPVLGAWCLVLGAWCLVLSAWFFRARMLRMAAGEAADIGVLASFRYEGFVNWGVVGR
jgi:hypothetical protein